MYMWYMDGALGEKSEICTIYTVYCRVKIFQGLYKIFSNGIQFRFSNHDNFPSTSYVCFIIRPASSLAWPHPLA